MSYKTAQLPARLQKARAGSRGFHAGLAAEDHIARVYETSGHEILARRWRGPSGEIDLVALQDEVLVFVEVKASRDFDRAMARLSRRQLDRVFRAADEFRESRFGARLMDMRFDLALVDRSGQHRILRALTP